jgi:hypothetical protein
MNTYEERITVWHADSLEEATTRADAEALECALSKRNRRMCT